MFIRPNRSMKFQCHYFPFSYRSAVTTCLQARRLVHKRDYLDDRTPVLATLLFDIETLLAESFM